MDKELPDSGISVLTGKPARTSAGRFWGWNTIYGKDGDHATPYMRRAWIGRLRFHLFLRGDQDPDCHDHPWDFWTFPLRSYVEEVVYHSPAHRGHDGGFVPASRAVVRQIVHAFHWHFRPAKHTHRVLGPWGGRAHDEWARVSPSVVMGSIPTIVWRSRPKRKWGFLKNRDGEWCWVAWKEYVFAGGKDAPCSNPEPDYMKLPPEEYDALFGTRGGE